MITSGKELILESGKMIRCVIFGCEQVTVDFVRFVKQLDDVDLLVVVTNEYVEDSIYGYESVVAECEKLGIEVINSKSIGNDVISRIQSVNPDVIFSTFYRCIFSQKILELPSIGCFNLHSGAVPDYKGFAPTTRAMMNGESHFGLTIHKMEKGIDVGDILVQKEFPIDSKETGFELHVRASQLSGSY